MSGKSFSNTFVSPVQRDMVGISPENLRNDTFLTSVRSFERTKITQVYRGSKPPIAPKPKNIPVGPIPPQIICKIRPLYIIDSDEEGSNNNSITHDKIHIAFKTNNFPYKHGISNNDSDSSPDASSSLMEEMLETCREDNSSTGSDTSTERSTNSDDIYSLNECDINLHNGYNNPLPASSDWPGVSSTCVTNENNHSFIEGRTCVNKSYMVAKEITHSENSFVDSLKLLNITFREFLIDKNCVARGHSYSDNLRSTAIPEAELDRILNNLPNLQNLNENILSDLQARISDWENYPKIADILVKKGPFLKLYATYIKELNTQTSLLEHSANRYPDFGAALKEFEASDMSLKIPICKHMLTPMQRITKYKELMKQYIKYLSPDAIDFEDAQLALQIVSEVAAHSNEAIRQIEKNQRLLDLQDRLNWSGSGEYSAEPASGGRHVAHTLVQPGKALIKDGNLLKLCRKGRVKVVYLILMTNELLYTTHLPSTSREGPLKLICKLPLDGMRVETPRAEDFQNEFSVISNTRSFTLRTSSPKERDDWIRALKESIEENALRKCSFQMAKTAIYESPTLDTLGKLAPVWIPDNRVTMCQGCTAEFSLTFRRHHCRACGKVVCYVCSNNRAPLEYMDMKPVRVCDDCYEILEQQLKEQEDRLSSLEDGISKNEHSRKCIRMRLHFKRGVRDSQNTKSIFRPERLREVSAGDLQSQMCGYLRHYYRRHWRQGWFVLKDKVLYEYRAPQDVCALESTSVLGYEVAAGIENRDILNGLEVANCFQLLHSNQIPLIFHADSADLAEKWRKSMEEAVVL